MVELEEENGVMEAKDVPAEVEYLQVATSSVTRERVAEVVLTGRETGRPLLSIGELLWTVTEIGVEVALLP